MNQLREELELLVFVALHLLLHFLRNSEVLHIRGSWFLVLRSVLAVVDDIQGALTPHKLLPHGVLHLVVVVLLSVDWSAFAVGHLLLHHIN